MDPKSPLFPHINFSDVIIDINGHPVHTFSQLQKFLSETATWQRYIGEKYIQTSNDPWNFKNGSTQINPFVESRNDEKNVKYKNVGEKYTLKDISSPEMYSPQGKHFQVNGKFYSKERNSNKSPNLPSTWLNGQGFCVSKDMLKFTDVSPKCGNGNDGFLNFSEIESKTGSVSRWKHCLKAKDIILEANCGIGWDTFRRDFHQKGCSKVTNFFVFLDFPEK